VPRKAYEKRKTRESLLIVLINKIQTIISSLFLRRLKTIVYSYIFKKWTSVTYSIPFFPPNLRLKKPQTPPARLAPQSDLIPDRILGAATPRR
jgi:hypothetical protein